MWQVPTLSLDEALTLVPAWLPIEKLKLDAQGLDLKILRSSVEHGSGALNRVRALELEVVKKGCTSLYAGQETHDTVEVLLRTAGFRPLGWRWHGHLRCEGTGYFTRA